VGGSHGRASGSENCRFGYNGSVRLHAAGCLGLFIMPLQIATASFALLFAATLMLGSRQFVDSRASNLNPVVIARPIR
jgi:hypothetical protein